PQEGIDLIARFTGIMLLTGGIILILGTGYNIVKNKHFSLLFVQALLCLAIGIAILLFKDWAISVFFVLCAVWAIILGVIQIVILVNLKETLKYKNLLLVNCLLTIGLGVVLFLEPLKMAAILVVLIGIVAVILGLALIYFSFLLRSIYSRMEKEQEEEVKPSGSASQSQP
ncbi:MAG: hypothetical protein FJY10_12195, partial [Bacteroidetes bacterium]|nr:hypothetical protein [Bacteroidota bacterium]